ncbi:hypothetical protein B0F90DRAFT_877807 [Multifurca ochricompacta]|uniref:Uncharacterized protein n=1 Tax=Multifurca ochricompacta TaxID=376703 RepID=A0AAD4M0D1_9AGAM|nr:hypothetical protein B0F90DRAFT_877807 [Multifurca ochricompacta]
MSPSLFTTSPQPMHIQSFEVPPSPSSLSRSLVIYRGMKTPLTMTDGVAKLSAKESDDSDPDFLNHTFDIDRDNQCHRDNGSVIGTIGPIRSVSCQQNLRHLALPPPESHVLIETNAVHEAHRPRPKPLSPILEQTDSPNPTTVILSPRDSVNSLAVSSTDSAIHFVDEDSGTVLCVQHASGVRMSAEQFALERSSLRSSLSLHIGSPPACAATNFDAHIESLPSFVLTLPTPLSPPSPIFSPGVHFTAENFLNATEAAARGDQVPTLPQCDHVQGDMLCRACEMQLLACRVWFQNADGGARAALHEPFVRPAESTVRTRAVLASLGVGAQCSSGIGLGFANGWNQSSDVQDDDDDIDDPGSLAIEALPAASSRLGPLSRAINGSRAIISKLRVHVKALSPSTSTISPGSRR